MGRFNKWMASLVPNRSSKSVTTDSRTVDLERQCVDFDSWFEMHAHLYKNDKFSAKIQARDDYRIWRNGFDPIQEKDRKGLLNLFTS